MTEDEAKTKWCPMARHDTTAGNRVSYGAPGDGPAPDDYCAEAAMRFPCIGSACMAWRLDSDEKLADAWDASGTGALPSIPDAESKRGGYCGLAGAPQ